LIVKWKKSAKVTKGLRVFESRVEEKKEGEKALRLIGRGGEREAVACQMAKRTTPCPHQNGALKPSGNGERDCIHAGERVVSQLK